MRDGQSIPSIPRFMTVRSAICDALHQSNYHHLSIRRFWAITHYQQIIHLGLGISTLLMNFMILHPLICKANYFDFYFYFQFRAHGLEILDRLFNGPHLIWKSLPSSFSKLSDLLGVLTSWPLTKFWNPWTEVSGFFSQIGFQCNCISTMYPTNFMFFNALAR